MRRAEERETKGEKRGGGVNSCSADFSEQFVARGCRHCGVGAGLAVGLGLRPWRNPREGMWGSGTARAHSEQPGQERGQYPGSSPKCLLG